MQQPEASYQSRENRSPSDTSPLWSEQQLVLALQQKDKTALSYLYDHYSGALFGVIVRIVKDQTLAEDILQETFVRIWRKISSYDPQKARLFTWMLTIARNRAIDLVRTKAHNHSQQHQPLTQAAQKLSTPVNLAQTELFDLKDKVAHLSPVHQQVIDILYFQGYSQSEAAKALEIPLGTVKTRARTAIHQLRTLLHE